MTCTGGLVPYVELVLLILCRVYPGSRLRFRVWPSTTRRTGLGQDQSPVSLRSLTWKRTKVSNISKLSVSFERPPQSKFWQYAQKKISQKLDGGNMFTKPSLIICFSVLVESSVSDQHSLGSILIHVDHVFYVHSCALHQWPQGSHL